MYGTDITLYLYNLCGEGVTEKEESTYTIYKLSYRDRLYAVKMTRSDFEDENEAAHDQNEIALGEVSIHRTIYLPFSMCEKENKQKAIEKYLSQQTEEIIQCM